jgi:RNA polymerase sigma factor (TIGR02999 family)
MMVPQMLHASPATEIRLVVEQNDHKPYKSAQELLPLVYQELRKLASARMAAEWDTSTLQPTALVHEAWMRLAIPGQPLWNNQAQFFAAAAEAMRRVLIDHARAKHALKRGADSEKVDLNKIDVAIEANDETLLLINEAIEKLAQQDSQAAELVKMRFFIGMSYQEAAQALAISERTAKRCWTFARAWLYRELRSASAEA